nr:MAG TPA: Baseplate structural protein [Bacteriophage sp.]
MCAGTKQPYKSVRKGNKMIFSTITQNNLNLTADTTEIPAQYSNNIQFKFIQDSERFSGYIPTIYIGVYDSAMIECSDVINAGGAVVVDGDGVFAISNEIMYRNGFLAVGVTLTNNDENVSLKPVIYRIQASVGGLSPLPPDEGEWQQVVKAFVETLFNNWSTENLDPIKAQLEELISTAQTQQEKITSQQTQIDNAIGNMGDYEIVQEDPVQIRFKKGDGTFGETVDLGDGLASKAMVNAGYYTYKGISYGGSASNNGIDVAEIDGAYSQETTNGKNLLNITSTGGTNNGITYTINDDKSVTLNGATTDTVSQLILNIMTIPNGTYCLNGTKTANVYMRIWSETQQKEIYKSVNSGSFEITNNDVCQIQIYIHRGVTCNNVIIYPQLELGSTATSYEPFTGGIASPNPEYPQEPKFVGDYNEGTQKYDIDFVTQTRQLFDASKLPTKSAGGATVTNNGDGSFTISGSGNLTDNFIYYYNYSHEETLNLLKAGNISLRNGATTNPRFLVQLKTKDDTTSSTTLLQLENNEIDPITQEMLNNPDTFLRIFFFGLNGSAIQAGTIKPMLYQDGDGTWEPFKLETTTVELNQPLRELPNGVKDTIENGVVTRRVGEITFNGSETWLKNAGNTNNWLYHIAITHVNAKGLCDSLPHNEIDVINSDGSGINRVGFNFTQYEKVMYLNVGYYMEQAGLTNTVDNLKTWLQSNPITVWYELATPTTEQITLPTLPSWYPYTDALVGTELQPSFVEWHIKIAGVNQNDLTVIKEDISQLQTETTQLNDDVTMLMGAFTSVTDLTKQLFLLMHRVGDIIFSTSDENPSTIYGGTWVAWGKGQVPVGVDTSDSDFNTVEKTGGEKEHTLTVGEMPSHSHIQTWNGNIMVGGGSGGESTNGSYLNEGGNGTYPATLTNNVGNSHSHNNLQPYITCYMWKRIA